MLQDRARAIAYGRKPLPKSLPTRGRDLPAAPSMAKRTGKASALLSPPLWGRCRQAEGVFHMRLPCHNGQGGGIPLAAMAGIIATVSVFALAQGLTYPLLSFILERQGTTPGLIGLSAAMTPLGFIVSAPLIPALARRVGAARLAVLCALLAALTLAAIGLVQDVRAWMPLRLLLGVFANPLYVISETWLIALTPAARRGRILGLYSSVVSGGFAIGPLSLGLAGTAGWAVGLFFGSVFLAWLVGEGRGSVLVVALWHTAYNLATATEANAGAVAAVATGAVVVATVWIMRTTGGGTGPTAASGPSPAGP